MSKVVIAGDTSGTGTFTISSPNSNTDRTLVLPDEAGTIDTLQRAGNVLQVVHGTISTAASTTSATYSATGISLSITPSSASSKILILSRVAVRHQGFNYGSIRWLRGSTVISAPSTNYETGVTTAGADVRAVNPYIIFDSPNTTSPVTYSAQFASYSGTFSVQPDSMITQTILMEIAA